MFPGIASKLSYKTIPTSAVIDADADVIFFTNNTTQITTINSKHGTNAAQLLNLVALNGNVTLAAGGNILGGLPFTLNASRLGQVMWNPNTQRWYTEF